MSATRRLSPRSQSDVVTTLATQTMPSQATPSLAALRPLLVQLNNTKRMRSADEPQRSMAARSFARSWRDLAAGIDVETVAWREAAAAVSTVVLGAIDAASLCRAGLSEDKAHSILCSALVGAGDALTPAVLQRLTAAVPALINAASRTAESVPSFVQRLQDQPRAGATSPTADRLMLEPAESHADHSLAVAVAAVLIAGQTGTNVAAPFLAGLAHHLHNATLPDGGFAAEELLGPHWPALVEEARAQALRQLPLQLADQVRQAWTLVDRADDDASRAFQTADVLDRVIEAGHFEQVSRYRLADALGTRGLVHAGPLQSFQQRVLALAGLATQ